MRNRAAFTCFALACVLAPVTSARAWFVLPPLVFDLQRFQQQVEAVRNELQWIESLKRHLENDVRLLRHLDDSNLSGWTAGLQRLESATARMDALTYEPQRLEQHIEQNWPVRWSGEPHESADALRDAWLAQERAAAADCRAVQNAVVLEMPKTEARVADLIDASNRGDGLTVALQARTQLHGELSGELSKLQALRLTRAALRSEQSARRQAESARAEAVLRWLMRSGVTPPPRGTGMYRVDDVPEQPLLEIGAPQ